MRSFSAGAKTGNICDFLHQVFQNFGSDCGGGLAKDIRKHIIQLDVGNGEAVLDAVFLAGGEVGQFPTVTYQIPKLADICRRDKAPSNKTVLKDVSNPFGVPSVGFLTLNRFYIFWVSENNIAGSLQNIVNGNPIFPSGFHTHIFAVILRKLGLAAPQISGKGRKKALVFVGCCVLLVVRVDTSNDKGFVDIHPTAYMINNFEYNTSPKNNI